MNLLIPAPREKTLDGTRDVPSIFPSGILSSLLVNTAVFNIIPVHAQYCMVLFAFKGHVDATGTVVNKRLDGEALWVTIKVPAEVIRFIVEKGYIAIDGTSLTASNQQHQQHQQHTTPNTNHQTNKNGVIFNIFIYIYTHTYCVCV